MTIHCFIAEIDKYIDNFVAHVTQISSWTKAKLWTLIE